MLIRGKGLEGDRIRENVKEMSRLMREERDGPAWEVIKEFVSK